MRLAGVSVDFSKAKVVSLSCPRHGAELVVEGAIVAGRAIRQLKLRFEAVANQAALLHFVMAKNATELEKLAWLWAAKKSPLQHQKPYPLNPPARLTELRPSQQSRPSYSDEIFEDWFGPVAPLRPSQHLYHLALGNKRFKNTKLFPIVCQRMTVTDASGKLISGVASKPRKSWKPQDYDKIVRRFSQAILESDYPAGYALISPRLQKRLSLKNFAAEFEKHRRNLPNAEQMDSYYKSIGYDKGYPGRLDIDVTPEEEFWETPSFPSHLNPESCCTWATIYFHGLYECRLTLVEEGGTLRVGHYENTCH